MIDIPTFWLEIGELILIIFPLVMIYCLCKEFQHDLDDDREE